MGQNDRPGAKDFARRQGGFGQQPGKPALGGEVVGAYAPAMPMPFFVATEAQSKFSEAVLSGRYTYLLYGGGIRSGKTALVLMTLQLLAKVYPKSRWAVVRKDLPTLRRNVLPTWEKFRIPGFAQPVNQSNWTSECRNGSQIIFFTESLSEDPDLDRWKGLEVNGFALEEANELAEVSWSKAIERAGAWVVPKGGNQPPPLILLTCNPSPGWIKTRFYDRWKAGSLAPPYYFQPATIADNPHLPKEYIESLKNLPEHERRRFVQGDWSVAEATFYEELAEPDRLFVTTAQMPEVKDHHEWWGAYDWGYAHPACFSQFVRIDDTIYCTDTKFLHRYQDDEQAAEIAGWADRRACRMVYAGHDAFAKRQAHTGGAETVADVFDRYQIHLEHAHLDRAAGAKTLRRFFQAPKLGPQPKGTVHFRWVDTPGNRMVVSQLQALSPDPLNINVPAKRDANAQGENGDDGADCLRNGLATPSFETDEPLPVIRFTNVSDGTHPVPAPWETQEGRLDEQGRLDKRTYVVPKGVDANDSQFFTEEY